MAPDSGIDIKEISSLLTGDFDIRPEKISRLDGYANANYLVITDDKKFVLKQYAPEPGLAERLEAESRILELLTEKIPRAFQQPVRTTEGEFLLRHNPGERETLFRLLHFIEGDLLTKAPHSKAMFESFGRLLGEMDRALLTVRDPAIEAYRHEWDLLEIDRSRKYFDLIEDPADRRMVKYFHLRFHDHVLPRVPELRKSIIHGDANDLNVLVRGGKVSGLIDFGDMTYSLLINELAVAVTYAMFGKQDPLSWATSMIKGYTRACPIEETEAGILYDLIGTRLCITVSRAAKAARDRPDDPYMTVSLPPARQLLRQWIRTGPVRAGNVFRQAAGFESKIHDTTGEDLRKRQQYLSKALSLSYRKPVKMAGAAFQFMYDALGNTYLDTRNNIPHVGHSHPVVVEAGRRQMLELNTNTRYLYDGIIEYSEKLLSKFPPSLNKVFYVNSGSAASDLALRLALTHTGKEGISVMEYGYHGNTRSAIDISHYKFAGKGGAGKRHGIIVAPAPDTYRGPYRDEKTAGAKYARNLLNSLRKSGDNIAAFIAEPVISAAGQISLPAGYLGKIYPFIRNQGGVCISDEVQTGFGRLGTHFWGFEQSGVIPDIVVLGKPMGNGHPMAAVVCTEAIARSFENGMEFFSSYGGNPVSCAIGLAVLNVIEDENLMDNARKTGNCLIRGFRELSSRCRHIGDVRGSGFSLGVDIVEDQETRKPGTGIARQLVEKLKNAGILTGTDGPADNVLKIKPPMCFNMKDADRLLEEMEHALPKRRENS